MKENKKIRSCLIKYERKKQICWIQTTLVFLCQGKFAEKTWILLYFQTTLPLWAICTLPSIYAIQYTQ